MDALGVDRGERMADEAASRPEPSLAGSSSPVSETVDVNDNLPDLGAARFGYFGVVLRAHGAGDERRYEIILAHRDERFSRLFATYEDDEFVIADWRSLGADLRLPLYIVDAQGRLECATIDAPICQRLRRLGSPLSGRRPRFLSRRRVGQPSLMSIRHPVAVLGR